MNRLTFISDKALHSKFIWSDWNGEYMLYECKMGDYDLICEYMYKEGWWGTIRKDQQLIQNFSEHRDYPECKEVVEGWFLNWL